MRAAQREALKGVFSRASLDLRWPPDAQCTGPLTDRSGDVARYLGSDRVLHTTAADEPVTDGWHYNPSSGLIEPGGLRVEGARTNVVLRSEAFDNADWTKANSTINADAVVAPDGSTTADKLVEDNTASTTHLASQPVSADTSRHTLSIFVKAAERDWLRLLAYESGSGNGAGSFFDVANGVAGSDAVFGTGVLEAKGIEDYGNGWYRCWVSISGSGDGTTLDCQINLATGDNGEIYDGDGSSGLYIWGAQFEKNENFPSSYIPTTTAAVTRSADIIDVPQRNWFANQRAGTFFSTFFVAQATQAGFHQTIFRIDGASAEWDLRRWQNTDDLRFYYNAGGTVQLDHQESGIFSTPSQHKAAFAARENDIVAVADGAVLASVSSASLGDFNTVLRIGNRPGGTNEPMQGYIKCLAYWPYRLPDSTLKAITS